MVAFAPTNAWKPARIITAVLHILPMRTRVQVYLPIIRCLMTHVIDLLSWKNKTVMFQNGPMHEDLPLFAKLIVSPRGIIGPHITTPHSVPMPLNEPLIILFVH